MNKVLFILLASFLVLTACGQQKESKFDDKKSKSKKKETKPTEAKKKDEKQNKTISEKQEDTTQKVDQQPQHEQVDIPQIGAPQQYTEAPIQQESQLNKPSMSEDLDYNYPHENKTDNPSGYINEVDVQSMADKASEYDAEVAKHNANIEAHNEWIKG